MRKTLFILVFISLFFPAVNFAYAYSCVCPSGTHSVGSCGECGSACRCETPNSSSSGGLTNPLGGAGTPQVIIGRVIGALLGFTGSLALLMFIYGGFTWMLAAGNNERVQKGKNILIWASIGLAVIFSAYALVKFVFEGLGVM